MITVIDMATGDVIYSSTAKSVDAPLEKEGGMFHLALGLQEVQSTESEGTRMPPELVDCPVDKFLTKFE